MDRKIHTLTQRLEIFTTTRNVAEEGALRTAVAKARIAWRLTPREADVLLLLVRGSTNKDVAANLGCHEGTVEAHVGRTLRKSDCQNRVTLATRMWLLYLDEKS